MPTERLFADIPAFPADIPTAPIDRISLSELEENSDNALKAVFKASREKGYFLLDLDRSVHGQLLLQAAESMFDVASETFDTGPEELQNFSVDLPRDIQGYKCIGRIKTDYGKSDAIEFFTIHQDDITGIGPIEDKPHSLKKRLIDCQEFIRQTHKATDVILRALEKELDLPSDTLTAKCSIREESTTALRLLRSQLFGSAAIEKDHRPIKLGGHTDIGTVTILFNTLGGLQILPPGLDKREENWRYVRPEPGCAVVQIGDTLVEWTGGVLRSNLHRVVDPPGLQASAVRQSVAYLQRASERTSMSRLKHGTVIPPLRSGDREETRSPSEWAIWRNSQIMQGKLKPQSNGGIEVARQAQCAVWAVLLDTGRKESHETETASNLPRPKRCLLSAYGATNHAMLAELMPQTASSCIGKKLNSLPAACADSTTIEPLLFLYPTWFRSATHDVSRVKVRGTRKWSSSHRRHSRAVATDVDIQNQPPPDTNLNNEPELTEKHDAPTRLTSERIPTNLTSQSRPSWIEKEWRPFNENIEKQQKQVRSREFNKYLYRDVKAFDLAHALADYPPSAPDEQDEIRLGTAFLEWLTGTAGENIWKHHDGTGCIIHVSPPPWKDRPTRLVFLKGSQRAREIAAQHLQHLEKSYHTKIVDTTPSGASSNNCKESHTTHLRVDQLPEPSDWNIRSFSAYVKAVTNARAPRNIERVLYPGDDTFDKAAAKVLIDLFENPALQPFQSSFALRQALELCSVNTDIAFAARRIWTAARQAGILPDIACFNHELNRCFTIRNTAGLAHLVEEMRDTHTWPNASTWACLFNFLRSKEEQELFLDFSPIRRVKFDQVSKDLMIQALVKISFRPSDRDVNCLRTFRKQVMGVFGSEWLSPPVLEKMIAKCTQTGSFRVLSRVLELATNQSISPDSSTFTSLLHAIVDTGCFDDVLALLRLQTMPSNSGLDGRQIELVFREAWKQRLSNTCRVLWHYGASHGLIEHSMMTKVARSLAQNVPLEEGSTVDTATRMAAVVIGTDRLNTADARLDSHLQSYDLLETLESLSKWLPNGKARHDQLQLAHTLVERDLTAWQRYTRMEYPTLMNLMDEAFALDVSWLEQNKILLTSVPELLQQAIPVNLEPIEALKDNLVSQPDVESQLAETWSSAQPNTTTSTAEDRIVNNRPFLTQNDLSSIKADKDVQVPNAQHSYQAIFSDETPAIENTVMTTPFSYSPIEILMHRLGLARENG